MPNRTKSGVEKILLTNVPRWVLLCIVLSIAFAASSLFLWPLLSSLATWQSHRRAVFAGETIQIPIGWIIKDTDHLLNLKKPGPTLFSGPGSQIIIDPFAERHRNNLPLQRRLWLEGHGMIGEGELRNPATGSPIPGLSDMQCAQSEIVADKDVPVNISCISTDSLFQYEFWGRKRDFPAFQNVCVQAGTIARRHPGAVRPK